MAVTLDQILTATKAWEELELQPAYPDLVSYKAFPSQEDIDDEGLTYPHIIHVWIGSVPQVLTIGNPIEVLITWAVETYVVVANAINDLTAQQDESSQMAIDYLTGWYKHRGLGGLLTVKDNQLRDCGFGEWDLFGMHIVGHKWLSQFVTRQTMAVE